VIRHKALIEIPQLLEGMPKKQKKMHSLPLLSAIAMRIRDGNVKVAMQALQVFTQAAVSLLVELATPGGISAEFSLNPIFPALGHALATPALRAMAVNAWKSVFQNCDTCSVLYAVGATMHDGKGKTGIILIQILSGMPHFH
jgi:hypothetical protein